MVTYVDRPKALSGSWGQWAEQDQPAVLRSGMDDGTVKVRRRFTGVYRIANVAVNLPLDLIDDFMAWFRTDCQQGVLPTVMVEPSGVQSVWRFTQAPQVAYIGPGIGAATVTCVIEQLPGWPVVS